MQRKMQPSLNLASFLLSLFVVVFWSITTPANALNIGVQITKAGFGLGNEKCSRTCESKHCTVPPFLKYGKYCGILYSGCPGEKPCDALDACCMVHDACVTAKNDDYLSQECNENFLSCITALRGGKKKGTFRGNQCMIDEVIDVIQVVMEAAVFAGRVLHKP